MKQKLIAILMVCLLAIGLVACGSNESADAGSETTLTGMVVSVDGTVITLMETDGTQSFSGGERPTMPEGMEGFSGEFDGTRPAGGERPQWGNGEMPQWGEGEMPQRPEGMEGFQGFGNFDPENFQGGNFPQWGNGEMPEGMTLPENGERPEFGGRGENFNMEDFVGDAETTQIDIASAHISTEVDGVKATAALSDVTVGSMVTITLNGDGEATYVLITSQFRFGGRNNEN